MVSVRVFFKQSGKPAKGISVSVSFDGIFSGGITKKIFTDSSGDAHFDSDPGYGTIYADGKNVYKGKIEGRTIVYV